MNRTSDGVAIRSCPVVARSRERTIGLWLNRQVDAPGRARKVVREVAANEAEAERAALLVSELVTNCIRHSQANRFIEVRIRSSAERLRVEVDDGGAPFDAEDVRDAACGGWGLTLVNGWADRWGVDRTRSGFWFEIDRAHVASA